MKRSSFEEKITQDVGKIHESLQSMRDWLEGKFQAIDHRFDIQDEKIDGLRDFTVEHVEKLHEGQAVLIEKFDRLDRDMNLVKADIAYIKADIVIMKTDIKETKFDVKKVDKRVEQLERHHEYA